MQSSKRKLLAIDGHKHLKRCSATGVIYYVRSKTKFCCHTDKIGKALDYVQQKLSEQKGIPAHTHKRKVMGVRQLFLKDLWPDFINFKSIDAGESTILNYQTNWRNGLKDFWANMTTDQVNDQSIINFKAWYLKNHPTRYVSHTTVHLQAFFSFLKKSGYMTTTPDFDPLKGLEETIKRNARREKAGRRLSEAEVDALLEVTRELSMYAGVSNGKVNSEKKRQLAQRAHLGILLGVRLGLRKMEAMTLKWETIDLDRKIMRVWSQKNFKWRDVPLIDEVVHAMKKQKIEAGSSDWVFPGIMDPSTHISSQVFDKCWVRAKSAAKIINRTRFHDLRHTFASITADENWPPVVACDLLDMSLKIYQKTYCKPSFEKKAEMLEKTFEILKSTSQKPRKPSLGLV